MSLRGFKASICLVSMALFTYPIFGLESRCDEHIAVQPGSQPGSTADRTPAHVALAPVWEVLTYDFYSKGSTFDGPTTPPANQGTQGIPANDFQDTGQGNLWALVTIPGSTHPGQWTVSGGSIFIWAIVGSGGVQNPKILASMCSATVSIPFPL